MGLLDLFKRKTDERGIDLYESALAQARQAIFHTQLGVPDSLDGRFDLIVLHLCLLREALLVAGEKEGDGTLLQAMDERFITDMDYALREVGVGDLSVGKQVKAMAGAYQGRWKRYRAAFAHKHDRDLVDAISANVYRDEDKPAAHTETIARYCRAQIALLSAQSEAIRRAQGLPWTPLELEAAGGAI
ncbi:MAG: ubiquinol-cytochrome C chaperone family protein [Pseudomonadota bacterium]